VKRGSHRWTDLLMGTAISAWAALPFTSFHLTPLSAQTPPALELERREFAHWLETSPLSPYAAIALQPVGPGISIGPEPSDIPLPIATRGIATENNGAIVLDQGNSRLVLPRGRPVPLQNYRLVASGTRGRMTVAAYGSVRHYSAPGYFSFSRELVFSVLLAPPERRGFFRTLGPDGTETEAAEIGMIRVQLGDTTVRLRVYRMGGPEDEEAELMVFFRDQTNDHGSYPAGRFVELRPAGAGRYQLDFNRARNPFCAYSTVFPCPAPWPGNSIPAPIRAGEQYRGKVSQPG
jgi:uncharacterized protein